MYSEKIKRLSFSRKIKSKYENIWYSWYKYILYIDIKRDENKIELERLVDRRTDTDRERDREYIYRVRE